MVSGGRRVPSPLLGILAVLVIVAVFVITQILVAAVTSLLSGGPGSRPRPEPNPVGAYAMEVATPGAGFMSLTITPDGDECEVLRPSGDPYRSCLVATNLIPSVIGGDAHGELNAGLTPAYHALVWRARADADPTVCERGGLQGALLDRCHAESTDSAYEFSQADHRIRIPLGGAVPSPGP